MFFPTVKYTVKVYTPDAHARSYYRLTARIKGQGDKKTTDHVLHETTPDRQKYDMSFLCSVKFKVWVRLIAFHTFSCLKFAALSHLLVSFLIYIIYRLVLELL